MKDLKSIIEEKYGTVYQFLSLTSFSKAFIYTLLKDENPNPTKKQIQKLATHLEVSTEEIINALDSNRSRDHGSES